jgi:hypothetical protein
MDFMGLILCTSAELVAEKSADEAEALGEVGVDQEPL